VACQAKKSPIPLKKQSFYLCFLIFFFIFLCTVSTEKQFKPKTLCKSTLLTISFMLKE